MPTHFLDICQEPVELLDRHSLAVAAVLLEQFFDLGPLYELRQEMVYITATKFEFQVRKFPIGRALQVRLCPACFKLK